MRSTLGCGTLAAPSLGLVVSLLPKPRKSTGRSRVQLWRVPGRPGRPASLLHKQMLAYDMNIHDIFLSYTTGHWNIPVWLCMMLSAWDMYLTCWVRTSGILTTWYKHVCTCLNNVCTCFRQCYCMYTAETCIYKSWNVYTCIYMVCTKLKNHKHVLHGMYMVCTKRAINMYVHGSDMYVHVYTFTYKYCIIQTWTYKVQTCIYRQCSVYRWLHTFHELYRQRCTVYIHRSTVYVHWYILSAAAFLFARLAGLLAGTGCCLVSHLFKFKHTSLIGISLRT